MFNKSTRSEVSGLGDGKAASPFWWNPVAGACRTGWEFVLSLAQASERASVLVHSCFLGPSAISFCLSFFLSFFLYLFIYLFSSFFCQGRRATEVFSESTVQSKSHLAFSSYAVKVPQDNASNSRCFGCNGAGCPHKIKPELLNQNKHTICCQGAKIFVLCRSLA